MYSYMKESAPSMGANSFLQDCYPISLQQGVVHSITGYAIRATQISEIMLSGQVLYNFDTYHDQIR